MGAFFAKKKSRKKVVKSEKKTVETFQVDGPLSKTMRESLKAKFSPMQYLKSWHRKEKGKCLTNSAVY